MKKIRILLIVLLCLLSTTSKVQGMNLDSAIARLKTTKEDTNKVLLLKKIAWDISYESSFSKDGMDMVLCKYNFKNMQLTFACANNPLWLFRDNILSEFKADKMPVGVPPKEILPFTLQTLQLEKNDIVYTFTDGYADQLGGIKGK